jgi:hypothetical protein
MLKALRGKASQASVAEATGLNTRTLVRAESGEIVALSTLRILRNHFKLDDAVYAELLTAWVKLELGEDAAHLAIKPRPHGKKKTQSAEHAFLETFIKLPGKYQEQLRLAIKRKEVLASLVPLNKLYSDLKSQR